MELSRVTTSLNTHCKKMRDQVSSNLKNFYLCLGFLFKILNRFLEKQNEILNRTRPLLQISVYGFSNA